MPPDLVGAPQDYWLFYVTGTSLFGDSLVPASNKESVASIVELGIVSNCNEVFLVGAVALT